MDYEDQVDSTRQAERQTGPDAPLLARALASIHSAVFITDPQGAIVWVNEAFSHLSGYVLGEVLGHTPQLLNAGKQGAPFDVQLWQSIQAGKAWQSDEVNRHKQGACYSVDQIITPLFDQQGNISHFIAVQHDITARTRAGRREHHLANYDALTGLPNRVNVYARLKLALRHARREARPLCVLFLDLDCFKPVNDMLGHHTGDKLLSVIGERMRSTVRRGDVVGRHGGDEFVILICDDATPVLAAKVAAKLLASLTRPYAIAGKTICVGASIGIALYPADGATSDVLLKHADRAMYIAKAAGGNSFQFYGTGTDSRA